MLFQIVMKPKEKPAETDESFRIMLFQIVMKHMKLHLN